MKTLIFKSALFIAITTGILTSCVKDDNYSTPDLTGCTETTLVKNREVSQILSDAVVKQHVNIVPGVSDIIEAYVTSSDIGGNFFKSISFQTLDKTKAFSIPVDATSTFVNYEPGRKVLINMDKLYTDFKNGGVRIGGLFGNSSGGAEVGRLPLSQFVSAVNRSCTIVNEDQLVNKITIAQAIASDAYVNKLIEFNLVQFDNNAITSTYYNLANDLGGATNYNLTDLFGNSIVFRTSSFSNFASKPVATGSGKVRGVLTKFGTTFQFVVRTEKDINMTGARFTPLLNEAFASNIGSWTNFSVTGAQIWTYSATFGNPDGMVKMSGFAGSSNANEDWLISPPQNLVALSNGGILTFDNAYKFTGPSIKVLISNNYSGTGDPNLATWTDLSAGINLSNGNYVWANSGSIDVTNFTGAGNSIVYVAFKYISTVAESSTWEIDNVKIIPN